MKLSTHLERPQVLAPLIEILVPISPSPRHPHPHHHLATVPSLPLPPAPPQQQTHHPITQYHPHHQRVTKQKHNAAAKFRENKKGEGRVARSEDRRRRLHALLLRCGLHCQWLCVHGAALRFKCTPLLLFSVELCHRCLTIQLHHEERMKQQGVVLVTFLGKVRGGDTKVEREGGDGGARGREGDGWWGFRDGFL